MLIARGGLLDQDRCEKIEVPIFFAKDQLEIGSFQHGKEIDDVRAAIQCAPHTAGGLQSQGSYDRVAQSDQRREPGRRPAENRVRQAASGVRRVRRQPNGVGIREISGGV